MKRRYLIVIPARMKSTRLPGKPLMDIYGKPMIVRTYECAAAVADPKDIIVATDHDDIANVCREHNIQVCMTSENWLTGPDRIYEVSEKIESDYYINLQSDEPIMPSENIKKMIDSLNGNCMSAIGWRYGDKEDLKNLHTPKFIIMNKKASLCQSLCHTLSQK